MKNEDMPPVAFSSSCPFVEENPEGWGAPGLVLGIPHQGGMATAGFGVTTVEHPLPMTGEMLSRIGSMTATTSGGLAASTGCSTQQFAGLEPGLLAGKPVAVHMEKPELPGNHSMPPMSLTACGKDRLLILDCESKKATADIVRRSGGSIGWVRRGHRCSARHEGHTARSEVLGRQNRSSREKPTRGVSCH